MRAKRIFYTRFQKILCVFFQIFQFLVKLKPNEKAIQKIICIDCDHRISKCPSISELFHTDNRPRDASSPVQQINTFYQFPRNTLYFTQIQISEVGQNLNTKKKLEYIKFIKINIHKTLYILTTLYDDAFTSKSSIYFHIHHKMFSQ